MTATPLSAYNIDTSHSEIRGIQIRTWAGLDLGQKQDFTTLAVIESHEITYADRNPVTYEFLTSTHHAITHLERLPLGTPYPEIVDTVQWTLEAACAQTFTAPTLIVDATGVGAPVVDLFRERGLRRNLVPVTITSGHGETHTGSGAVGVPKRNLITGLQVAFETHQLTLSSNIGPAVETLISELMNMQCEVTAHGNERFGARREGMHDDLVLATALAWWGLNRNRNKPEMWGRRRLI
jgi:hypothetical protein